MKLNSKKKRISVSRALIVFLAIYLFFTTFSTFFENIFFDFKTTIDLYLINQQQIKEENISLKLELEKEKEKNIFARYYYNRAIFLENSLLYQQQNKLKRKRYFVEFSPTDSIYTNIILRNKKDENIINIGDKVYLFDNFVFGKVAAIEGNIIKIRDFSDFNFENNFVILVDDKIIYRGSGKGDSNGLIKIGLPRDLIIGENSILILDDGSGDIVGKFLRDDFKSQNTQRDVYFKMTVKPEQVLEVEI